MTTIEMQQYQQQYRYWVAAKAITIIKLSRARTHARLFNGQQYGTLHTLNCPCLGALVACRARIYIEIYSIEY